MINLQVREEQLLTKGLEICENCEWCIPALSYKFPHCLLTGKEVGLVQKCKLFKWRTGNHMSMQLK